RRSRRVGSAERNTRRERRGKCKRAKVQLLDDVCGSVAASDEGATDARFENETPEQFAKRCAESIAVRAVLELWAKRGVEHDAVASDERSECASRLGAPRAIAPQKYGRKSR